MISVPRLDSTIRVLDFPGKWMTFWRPTQSSAKPTFFFFFFHTPAQARSYPTVQEVWLHLKLLFPRSLPENRQPSLSSASTNHAVIADGSLGLKKGAGPALFKAGLGFLKHKKQKPLTAFIVLHGCRRCQTVPDCPWPARGSCHISLAARRNGVWLRLFLPRILLGLY